MAPILLIFTSY